MNTQSLANIGELLFIGLFVLLTFVVVLFLSIYEKDQPKDLIGHTALTGRKLFFCFFVYWSIIQFLPSFISALLIYGRFSSYSGEMSQFPFLETFQKVSPFSTCLALGCLLFFLLKYAHRQKISLLPPQRSIFRLIGSVVVHYVTIVIGLNVFYLTWSLFLSRLLPETFSDQPVSLLQTPVLQFLQLSSPLSIFVFLVNAAMLAPITEEIFFRGILFRTFRRVFSPQSSLFLSAFIFSALHFNMWAFPGLFLLGCFLGHCYEKTGDIREPIGIHIVFNLVNLVCMASLQWK